MRHALSKYGGSLAETGAVSWNFEQKGYFTINAAGIEEDEIMMAALDAGADDVQNSGEFYEVFTSPTEFHSVLQKMEAAGYPVGNAELTLVPKNYIQADDVAEKLLRLIDAIEDLDDVQKVYANFDFSDETLAKLNR